MKKVFLAVLLSLFLCGVVNAADVTGKWKGSFEYSVITNTYNYKLDDYNDFTMKLTQNRKRINGTFRFDNCSKKGTIRGIMNGNVLSLQIKTNDDFICELNFKMKIKSELSEDGQTMNIEITDGYVHPDGTEYEYITGNAEATKVETKNILLE